MMLERRPRRVLLASLAVVLASTVVLAVPSSPTNLTAVVTGSTVTLSWNAATGVVTGYRLEAGTAPGLSNVASGVIGAVTRFVATAVPPGTYYVRVRAIAPDGESPPSNEVIATVGGGPAGCAGPPNAPAGLMTTINGLAVTVAWTSSGGCAATNYVLFAGSTPGSSNIAIANVGPATSLSVVAPVGSYYVRVIAQNASGSSGPSNEVSLAIGATPTPNPTAPGLPTGATDAALAFCVAETNRYRATIGATPLSRSSAVEAYAAAAAASDSRTLIPHGYSRTATIAGAWAENEVMRWPLAFFRTVEGAMRVAIAAFWGEGPGGGHFENMRGRFSLVGCGVAIDGQSITLVQHFR